MNATEFAERLTHVAEAFGKKLTDQQVVQYYEHFESLNDYQWRKLCDWAVDTQERFPVVATLKQGALGLHFYERYDNNEPTKGVTVVCKCGSSFFAWDEELKPGAMFQCVGGMGEACNRKWASGYILKNAHDKVFWDDEKLRLRLAQ